MMVLVTYDVNTETKEGKKRLSKVAKCCLKFGQRVQNSVFECDLNGSQFELLKHDLSEIINPETDSLRFYNLGENYSRRILHIGAKPAFDPESVLIV